MLPDGARFIKARRSTNRRGLVVAGAGLAGAAAAYWGVAAAVTPAGRRLLRPWVLSEVPTDRPLVALTFDDGPDPRYTEGFVDRLDGARSTFFVLGASARRWPESVRGLVRAGHEVACHGDTHRSLATLGPLATLSALRNAHASIAEVAGAPPRYYRPAYGCFTLPGWLAAQQLGMRRTLWTAWARDWEERSTPLLIARSVLRAARPGAILLLHDANGSEGAPRRTLQALPAILTGLSDGGLLPVTLSELVAAGWPDGSIAPFPAA